MTKSLGNFFMALFCVAVFACFGCSHQATEQSSPSDTTTVQTMTNFTPQSPSFLSPAPSHTSPAKAKTKGQTEDDKFETAINMFRAGEYISDQDMNYYTDVQRDPSNPSRGLEIMLAPDFFDLPQSERLRVARVYYKQWLSSIKEEGIKVNPRYKGNYLDATIILVDSRDQKNAGGMTDDTNDPVWVVND